MDSEKIHILLVDDDRSHRLLARMLLEAKLYRVTECSSGREAIEAVKNGSFDLVLLDVVMPGLNGIQTCLELRRLRSPSELSILFLSAKNDELSVVTALEAGAEDYIVKPFVPAIFIARVEAHLRVQLATKALLRSRETDSDQ